jgi:hypothetical protein
MEIFLHSLSVYPLSVWQVEALSILVSRVQGSEPRPAIADKRGVFYLFLSPEEGLLDEPYSAKPAQRSSHTDPQGYLGCTRFRPM